MRTNRNINLGTFERGVQIPEEIPPAKNHYADLPVKQCQKCGCAFQHPKLNYFCPDCAPNSREYDRLCRERAQERREREMREAEARHIDARVRVTTLDLEDRVRRLEVALRNAGIPFDEED